MAKPECRTTNIGMMFQKSNKPTKTKKAIMKTMNKFLSMAALALVGAMTVSCSSDDNIIDQPQQQEVTKNNVVTLTTTVGFDEAAGTTRALSSTGVKTFAAGETMAVIYNNGTSIVKAVSHALEAGDITNEGKNATFTFDLENPDKNGPVRYIYPAAMAGDTGVDLTKLNTQEGTFDALQSKYDFCTNSGAWDGDNLPSLTLENQLAILAITLKNSDGSSDITSSITGLTVGDGTNTYTVTREAGAGPVYVAIQPTSGATINVTATDGSKNYTKTLTGKTYAASNGYNVSWRMAEAVKPDLLSGVFSVSGSKTVKFSKGNLRYASGTWSFFDNQYDYYNSHNADAWDHFGWSTSETTYGMNTSTSISTYSGDFVDWGATMGTGWFTLSKDEWTYLFDTRSASTVGGTSNGRYAKAKVNGVQGIILFPDTYTHPDGVTAPTGVNATNNTGWNGNNYSSADWTKMESAGCVFLPAAGNRAGSSVDNAGTYGYYWSATPSGTAQAYHVYFYSVDLAPAYYNVRSYGCSVRMVREVTE